MTGLCGSCRLAGMGQSELRTEFLIFILAGIFRRRVGRYGKLATKIPHGTFQRGRICLTSDIDFGNIGLVRWARRTAGSPADIVWWQLVYAAVEPSRHSRLEGEAFVELHSEGSGLMNWVNCRPAFFVRAGQYGLGHEFDC